jgi:3-oxoacyl-[acyl-carrier protein] reductase
MSTPLALDGKVAVILGGTGGIGQATARRLAEHGAAVVLTSRSKLDEAASLAAALPAISNPAGHAGMLAAVEDTPSLVALAAAVEARYGRADILVNTAGFTQPIAHANLDALTDDFIDRMFEVNWRGQFAAIRSFAALLRANNDGLVVNISSIAGSTGTGSNIAYCAAKAGLDVMAMSLGRALAPAIRVLNVSPGVVQTDFVAGRDQAFNDKTAATTPLKRVGQPDDIADAVLACAVSLRFSTGTTLVVDGGRRLG